ncbi:MAG: hypothetical protein AAFY55_16780 [Bacteroidota bacterium]
MLGRLALHARQGVPVTMQGLETGSKGVLVTHFAQIARDTVFNDEVRDPFEVRGDRHAACHHGLDKGKPESFKPRGKQEGIVLRQVAGHIIGGEPAQKANRARGYLLVHGRLHFFSVRPLPGDRQTKGYTLLRQGTDNARYEHHSFLVVLQPPQKGDAQHVSWLSVCQRLM